MKVDVAVKDGPAGKGEGSAEGEIFLLRLNADLNFDGKIDKDDLDPKKNFKLERGAYVAVNNDDDGNNGTSDFKDGMVAQEKDLKKFSLELLPRDLKEGKIILARSNGNFRVFSDPQKGIKAPNDAKVLFSETADDFKAADEDNGKKTFDMSKDADRKAFKKLIESGLWVEGLKASKDLADSAITLSLVVPTAKESKKCDAVNVTVVEFTGIRATVPATQSKRKDTPEFPVRVVPPYTFDNVFKGSLFYLNEPPEGPDKGDKFAKAFEKPRALVLLRQAAEKISLELAFQPATVPIKWKIVPTGDDGKVMNKLPAFTFDVKDKSKASMGTDGQGSFFVFAYVDVEGNNTFKKGMPRAILPYILVNVQKVDDMSMTNATGFVKGIRMVNMVDKFLFASGINDPKKAAIVMNGTVDIIGGGPNGRRGTDRVFAGWINNNINSPYFTADYTGNHSGKSIFATNVPPTGFFSKTDTGEKAPKVLTMPMLDTDRIPAGFGGNTVTLGSSDITKRSDIDAGGTHLEVKAVDSPFGIILVNHPSFDNSVLKEVTWDDRFHAYLAVWTNNRGEPGIDPAPAAIEAAPGLYSIAADFNWTIKAQWTIDATGKIADKMPPSVTIENKMKYTDFFKPAKDLTVEVRPPTGMVFIGVDYSK